MSKQVKAPEIIVIGAGPAGLMAAGQAAMLGCRVRVLEKMPRPARKLCITGKGRCNITNMAPLDDVLLQFGKNGRFLRQALHGYSNHDLVDFFTSQGLPTVVERGGRVFPQSGKAMDVTDTLVAWAKKQGVRLQTASRVEALYMDSAEAVEGQAQARLPRLCGLRCQGQDISAQGIILCTGGASYPRTGSTGDGYALAQELGHEIKTIFPALIPLVSEEQYGKRFPELAGLTLRHVALRVFVNQKKRSQNFGELSFTEDGLGGPIILTESQAIVESLMNGDQVQIRLDLKPALDDKKLDARLQRDFTQRCKEPLQALLRGLLPRELIGLALDQTGMNPVQLGGEIRSKERKRLCHWLKNFSITISGHRPLQEAIVTAGGIRLAEVNPRTMGSHLVENLYFAGEVLDLQANTGGYNLQAAFSTGWLAGRSLAQALLNTD